MPQVVSRLLSRTLPACSSSYLLALPTWPCGPSGMGCVPSTSETHSYPSLCLDMPTGSGLTPHRKGSSLTPSLDVVLVTVLTSVTKYLSRKSVRCWGELVFKGAVRPVGEDMMIRTGLGMATGIKAHLLVSGQIRKQRRECSAQHFPLFFHSACERVLLCPGVPHPRLPLSVKALIVTATSVPWQCPTCSLITTSLAHCSPTILPS